MTLCSRKLSFLAPVSHAVLAISWLALVVLGLFPAILLDPITRALLDSL